MKGFLLFLAGMLCGGAAVVWLTWNETAPAPAVEVAAAPPQPAVVDGGAVAASAPAPAPPPPATAEPAAPTHEATQHTPPPAPPPAPANVPDLNAPVDDSLDSGDPDAPLPAEAEPVPLPPPAGEAIVPALRPPVAGAVLADTYADARGEGRRHDAIDIMAADGTPVRAVADGRIAKLFLSVPGGQTIYQFDSDERVAFYYAHLQRYADGLVEGMTVKQGDLIGYVGHSGNADPAAPHLHFAIFVLGPEKRWWEGTAVNPYPLLRGAEPGP